MKPKTLSQIKKFAIGTLMLGMAVIQPVNALPDSSPLNTVVTAEAASKVKLNKTKISLNKGKSYTLKLTGNTKKVSWSSSNKKVATVSSKGKVTAKKKGTATITAKVGSKKYKCKVTVKQPVTSVKLNKKSYTLKKKGATVTLKATVKPTNSNNRKVQWTTSNKNVATVNSKGKVTAVGNGTATITATATDGSKKKASCKITVKMPTVKVTKVTLNKTSASLTAKGQTVALTATVSPSNATNKTVAWKSGNTSVATVTSAGKVTAVANGTATITATAADGSGKSAACKITVNIPVAVTGVTLKKTAATLTAKGQTITLTASVAPSNASNKGITWSSSNANVATVNNGTVTAVSNGTTTITATAADGSGKKAACTITVNIPTPVVKVTSISLNKTSATLTAKGQTVALSASVAPSNADNKAVTWSSSNANVATVNNGTVTAVSNGTATITATAADGSGKKATCSVTVKIPNNVENVSLSGGQTGNCDIGSYDDISTGVNIKDITFEFNGNTSCIEIAGIGYEGGAYLERNTVDFRAIKAGTVQVIAKYNGKVLKIWNITVTSNWSVYTEYEAWIKNVEAQIWNSSMSTTQKLDAIENYIRTNFKYGGSDGYCEYKTMTADCWGAARMFGTMASDLGVTVGYVSQYTGQIYPYMNEATGSAAGHVYNAVYLNGQWVAYDATPLH